ncbi:MAG: oxygen-dependent coproporphyrinogen oxidase [Bacteroidota bacterium]
MLNKEGITDWFKVLQDSICKDLENADGTGCFREDLWERPEGGGGRSRVITNGRVIEKGGVNFSAVEGALPEKISEALKLEKADFYATGVSIVLHPYNPWVPIIHMNVRYFETEGVGGSTWWFGGGIDLTPHYINREDANYFHQQLKEVCDKHDEKYYPTFKKWADDYFFLKHRNETRGIGGIFFDRLNDGKGSKQALFEFVQDVGSAFAPLYSHYMRKYGDQPFEEQHKEWQKLRRGRYVEFNLVWDKGTKFGLDTNGRTESILMSMPPEAHWKYDYTPENGTLEAETLSFLSRGINWISEK